MVGLWGQEEEPVSGYPKWMNHDLHPANLAVLCEGEIPSSICVPLRTGQVNPKISKRCSDHVVGLGLTAAMCKAAKEEGRRLLP